MVVVGERRERVAPCLAALLEQRTSCDVEVVLVDLAPARPPAWPTDHHAVRRLVMPASTPWAAARRAGVEAARAPIVAFLEEHVRVRPGWAAAVTAAHRGPWAGVGGSVGNANPGSGRSDVTCLLSYGLFRPPLPAGEATLIPGNNSTYKRDVLRSYGDHLETLLACDNVLMGRLRADGHRLYLDPAVAIDHLNETSLGSAARGYFHYHRCFGPLRASEFGWSWPRRLLYIAATTVIPIYFAAHFARFLVRRHPDAVRVFLGSLGFVYAAELAAATGQAVGLAFGAGDSVARFTRYELTEPRPSAGEHGR